jgi:hypothetical protein
VANRVCSELVQQRGALGVRSQSGTKNDHHLLALQAFQTVNHIQKTEEG